MSWLTTTHKTQGETPVKHCYLSAYTLAPLAIRSDHAAPGATTVQFIPGTALLGSLAEAHRLLRSTREDEFAAFFLSGRIQFPQLYPASFADDGKSGIVRSYLPVVPLPKTAQTCKRFPGFRPLPGENTDEERHGIRDSLLDWATFSLMERAKQPLFALPDIYEDHAHCAICQQNMDQAHGYYRQAKHNPTQKMKAQIETHLQTHTGINHAWGTVEEGILYSREIVDRGTFFWGDLRLPADSDLTQAFEDFLAEVDEERIIHIGTGRTRGLGSVKLEMRDAESVHEREDLAAFEQRLLEFDRALKKQAKAVQLPQSDEFYLALTLHSASIVCDAFLRYCNTITGAMLEAWLKRYLAPDHPAGTWRRIYQATEMQPITGWNALWGTPRSMDYALDMGSTFLFSCSQKPDEVLVRALYELEEEGIGKRRAEGFGRICLSDPFHLEGEQA